MPLRARKRPWRRMGGGLEHDQAGVRTRKGRIHEFIEAWGGGVGGGVRWDRGREEGRGRGPAGGLPPGGAVATEAPRQRAVQKFQRVSGGSGAPRGPLASPVGRRGRRRRAGRRPVGGGPAAAPSIRSGTAAEDLAGRTASVRLAAPNSTPGQGDARAPRAPRAPPREEPSPAALAAAPPAAGEERGESSALPLRREPHRFSGRVCSAWPC